MHTIDTIIDTIKDAKTTTLKTFVQEEQFRKPMLEMVEAEATLAKAFAQNTQAFLSKFKVS